MESKKKPQKIALIILVLIFLLVLAVFFFWQKSSVATVNGVVITRGEYSKELQSFKEQMGSSPEITSEFLEKSSLEHLILVELLEQYAEENNISLLEEEIDIEYLNRVSLIGGEEALKTYLADIKVSNESFMESIREDLLLIKSIKNDREEGYFKVSEEETRASYDTLVKNVKESGIEEEIPPYESVKEWFENQLLNQKVLAESESFMQSLKEKAQIEILI